MSLDVFEAKKMVTDYYESIRPETTVQGFTRYLATNGEDVLIVEDNPDRWTETTCYLFLCEMRNGAVYCELVH